MTDVHAFELNAQPHHHHHPHGHDHDHPHEHSHDHDHEHSWWVGIASALHLPGYAHTHDRPAASDPAYANELGIRALRVAFALLIATTLLQVVIYLSSGSVALLADTVHNLGDALNSVPLWIAFLIMRRVPNRRYTYGYGRAEDLAGLVIVASIVFSAGYILWEAAQKLINPEPLTNLGWVAAAAIIGFIGNEAVALIQIRTGRQIGSAAMIADGKHARIDGLTSLAVLGAAAGTWLGFPLLDPIIGLLIGVTIVFIARDAALSIWYRLMDAVDPALLAKVEQVLASHEEIREVKRVQLRWLGHRLQASIVVGLDDCFDLAACAELSEHLRHHLLHELPHLEDAIIAATPCAGSALTPREAAHHQPPGR